MDLQRYHSLL